MKIINKMLGAVTLFVLTMFAMLASCIGLILHLPLLVIKCLISLCHEMVDFSEKYGDLYDKD